MDENQFTTVEGAIVMITGLAVIAGVTMLVELIRFAWKYLTDESIEH